MKLNLTLYFILFLVFLSSMTVAQADGFKEGKWSFTMVTSLDNMPKGMSDAMQHMPDSVVAMLKKKGIEMESNGQGMSLTITQCITKQNPIPKHSGSSQKYCQETHEIVGNTVNFHASCNHNDMQAESTGSMIYNGDSVQGQIKIHEVFAGKVTDGTTNITGQYLGSCSTN